MKKIWLVISDVAVVVGGCVGVGFLSGKEAQVFFGNGVNVAIFGLFFFFANLVTREYCRVNNCQDVNTLSKSMFGKFYAPFEVVISLCCFVCIVTLLAGVEQCLSQLFALSKLPLYAFAAALLATLLLRSKLKALKIANAISVAMAAVLLIILLCKRDVQHPDDLLVPLYQPIVYALFSVTMSLGVLTQLATSTTRKGNLIASILSAVIISALLLLVLPICDFRLDLPTLGNVDNPLLLTYTVITLLLSAVTGIVANAYPLMRQLQTLIHDDTLCASLLFSLALAFSMFGFDFAVKVGYVAVGVVGGVVIALCAVNRVRRMRCVNL